MESGLLPKLTDIVGEIKEPPWSVVPDGRLDPEVDRWFEAHLQAKSGAALRHAAAMDPNNPMTHHLLGQTYRDMGRKEEAETELKISEQLQNKQDLHP